MTSETTDAERWHQHAENGASHDGADARAIDPHSFIDPEDGPLQLDPTTGVPKVLKAYVVHQDPVITVVPNFLSDREVAHLIELSEEYWVPSVVGTGVYKTNDESKDLKNKASPNRTSYSAMLRSAQTSEVERIEHRLAHLAGMDVDYLERLNMVRYQPGQFFKRHHDGRFRPKTVFVYLNDLPEGDGGETLFSEIGVKFVPRKGCAVMWSNVLEPGIEDPRTYHQGLAPLTTMKYGVNCFFNDKPLKQWEDIDSDFGDDDADEGAKARPRSAKTWQAVDPRQLQADAEPLPPGQLCNFVVCREPRVCVLPDMLSPEEIAALLSFLGPPESRVQAMLDLVPGIEERMAAVARAPLSHMEPLKIAKCEPNMTPDGQVLARGQYGKRFGEKVVCVFLNDVAEGGEVRFPRLGFQVLPRKGCAVLWHVRSPDGGEDDPRAVHQGRPPRAGTRYVAMGIFRGEPVRTAGIK
eukprot:CAMPEP_0183523058 /NCGR_PEP_ID=MMETSP0371-20130417/18885_1 /TAXON_ID=268820 /ORGANISM="Peridinium aciculiferum, Strain PAER-2" /LENGTH=466 /DNA_ID=CAMNT_0025721923 /DNA_START=21 /DNA_END=1422 /DNA_ORIENTATION=-